MILFTLLALAAAAAAPSPLAERTFRFESPAEAVLILEAGCDACDWGVRGREAAVLAIALDGSYSQHVVLFRGAPATYRLLLGPLAAGEHRVSVTRDEKRSARGAVAVQVAGMAVEAIARDNPLYPVVASAPVLQARPGSLERFSDVPLLLYAEPVVGPGGDGRRYTYVFSNEDGGTPADRLMATWGRVTDIELAYEVERDESGRVVREEIQAKDHVVRAFAGRRLGAHPVLYVATRNNMFDDRGKRTVRLAPAPVAVELGAASREAVMDANDWTYRVSSQEVRREGRVSQAPRPGRGRIPDPARFAYLEACGVVENARVAFDLVLDGLAQPLSSDAGRPEFRIGRSGCFRSAIALPAGAGLAAVRALRVRAHRAPPPKGGTASSRPPLVRLERINELFALEEGDRPGASVLRWEGPALVAIDGAPLVVQVPAARADGAHPECERSSPLARPGTARRRRASQVAHAVAAGPGLGSDAHAGDEMHFMTRLPETRVAPRADEEAGQGSKEALERQEAARCLRVAETTRDEPTRRSLRHRAAQLLFPGRHQDR